MGKEIERKYLIDKSKWSVQGVPFRLVQAYLLSDEMTTVRVRIIDEQAFLTIKSNTRGISRDEFEYEIPISDAQSMMKLAKGFPVEKTRWKVVFQEKLWEVDVFEGQNEGLIMAEIELRSEDELFDLPDWVGLEVSYDKRYFNSYLSKCPFTMWK